MTVEVQLQHLMASNRSRRKCHLENQDYPYLIDLNILNIIDMNIFIHEIGGGEVIQKAEQVHVKEIFPKKDRD